MNNYVFLKNRLLLGLAIFALAAFLTISWRLFGWSTENLGLTKYFERRFLGYVVECGADYDRDGNYDFLSSYSWRDKFEPNANYPCPPLRTARSDQNLDGSWDTWIRTDANDRCVYHIEADTDFDGTTDWRASFLLNDYRRVFAALTTKQLEDAKGHSFFSCGQACPENIHIAGFICSLPSEESKITEDQFMSFWRRAVDLEIVNGIDRARAEILAAGCLPDDLTEWPQTQLKIATQFMPSGDFTGLDIETIRRNYWEETWGVPHPTPPSRKNAESQVNKNHSTPPKWPTYPTSPDSH